MIRKSLFIATFDLDELTLDSDHQALMLSFPVRTQAREANTKYRRAPLVVPREDV
jgi:hypothetical protein